MQLKLGTLEYYIFTRPILHLHELATRYHLNNRDMLPSGLNFFQKVLDGVLHNRLPPPGAFRQQSVLFSAFLSPVFLLRLLLLSLEVFVLRLLPPLVSCRLQTAIAVTENSHILLLTLLLLSTDKHTVGLTAACAMRWGVLCTDDCSPPMALVVVKKISTCRFRSSRI